MTLPVDMFVDSDTNLSLCSRTSAFVRACDLLWTHSHSTLAYPNAHTACQVSWKCLNCCPSTEWMKDPDNSWPYWICWEVCLFKEWWSGQHHHGIYFFSINSFIFVYSFIVKRHFQETYTYKTFSINISGKNNLHPSMIPAEKCQVIPGQKVQK